MSSIATVNEFLGGVPVAYRAPKGLVVAIFDGKEKINLLLKKGQRQEESYVDFKGALRFYKLQKGVLMKVPDDLTIPSFLKRKPPTKEDLKRIAALTKEINNPTVKFAAVNGEAKKTDFLKPKGVSDEEWEERRLKKQMEKDEKKKERFKAMKENKLPKVSARAGLISVAAIAEELKIEGGAKGARIILRAKKYPKPGVGWAFDAKEAEAVKEVLKAGMAEPKTASSGKGGGGRRRKLKIPPAGGDTDFALSEPEVKDWKKKGKKLAAKEAEKALAAEVVAPKKKVTSKAAKAKMKGKKK